MFWRRREVNNDAVATLARVVQELRAEVAAQAAARYFAEKRITELRAEHAREVEEFRRRLAISQANFEWVTVSHNRLEEERARLLLRAGFAASPIAIAVPESSPPVPAFMQPATDRLQRDDRTPSIADLVASGQLFDDVGPQEARAFGLEDGEVYDSKNPLTR